jgi:hypothetical protein
MANVDAVEIAESHGRRPQPGDSLVSFEDLHRVGT